MTQTVATTEKPLLGSKYLAAGDWSSFIGQAEAKETIITAARAAKLLDEPMDHLLITSGTPGVGKTTLGVLAAAERGTSAIAVSGVVKYADARLLLTRLKDGDVIVWDEIHLAMANGAKQAAWLLSYTHDGVLLGPRGPEEVAKVTIIGCTTDAGRLLGTMLDRFTVLELTPYTEDEGAQIAMRMAREVLVDPLPEPTWQNCRDIAKAASNNPRLMRAVIQQIRNYLVTHEGANWHGLEDGYDLEWPLSRLGLTPDGLTVTDRRYLVCLVNVFGGSPAGKSALVEALQEPGGLAASERRLVEKGLIARTKSGRDLTTAGLRRARELQETFG